ncbi:MAG: hypothetical protein HQ518_23865 [Rhodopirellula sp.]|nr:hypothetical protein [Rhodopirellula sp.]
MLKQMLFDNPILVRHFRSDLRSPKPAYITCVVVLLGSLVMFAGYQAGGLGSPGFYGFFFGCQALALHLAGTSQVASSISAANDSGILDFHRISPLSPTATTLGFMFGGAVREYLIALLLLPFTLACALFSDVGIVGFLTSTLVLISSTLLFHGIAITTGLVARPGKTRNINSALGFIVLGAGACTGLAAVGIPVPGMLSAGPALMEAINAAAPRGAIPATFFGVELPVFLQSLFYQIPLTLFLVVAATRRMRSAHAMFFSKSTAVGFLATIATLSLGGVIEHPNLKAFWLIPMLAYVEFLIAVLMVLAISPTQAQYQGGARRAKRTGMGRPPLWQDDSSNRAAVFVMASLVVATVQVIQALVPALKIDSGLWRVAGTAAAVVAYFGFAAQYYSLKYQKRGKLALMMLVFFFWLLPLFAALLLATVMREEDFAFHIASLSPLFGIGAGSWTALIFSGTMAAIFFVLLRLEERRVWETLTQRAILKEDRLLDDADDNPFLSSGVAASRK